MDRTIHGRQDPAGQAGLVGKALVVWLLVVAVLGVGVVDAVSIARTTLHVSEIAAVAASDGAAAYRTEGHSLVKACEVVVATIASHDQSLKLGRNGCTVDDAGRVTVMIKTAATTILAGRLGPTERYALVVVRESNGGANV